MADYARITTSESKGVTIVNFKDEKILQPNMIQEMGDELNGLVEKSGITSILLDFGKVEFLSSQALNSLIELDKKVRKASGKLVLSNLRPEIQEVFVITRLNQLFKIKATVEEGLKAF